MFTDIEIASNAKLSPITELAKKAGINEDALELYGKYKAKIDVNKINNDKEGKVILVTAISPTKAGEGKSTTTIGLADAMNKIGLNTMVALREPSLGPVFGLKGGATGGGYAQVVPMEDINLHFTGDMHAITTANNLISACLDNHIYQGNLLNIDINNVVWKRCLDMNDRSLREITIAQGSKFNGVERKDGFIITVASEIMAVLCLSNDLEDLKVKLSKILVAYNMNGDAIYVKDLDIVGALALILKDAIKPNLVQTLENNPVLIHGGPFANIAHGCNSIIATKLARRLADYVVTEAGFGADLGAEKFLNIKCQEAGITPSAVVIVATIRALKLHGGVEFDNLKEENVESLIDGVSNLAKHIENVKAFGLPYVVAINEFATDTKAEIAALKEWALENDHPVVLSSVWAKGGEGAIELAKTVKSLVEKENTYKALYDKEAPIKEKIETICKTIYGAKAVNYSETAEKQIEKLTSLGYDKLRICMAKTPLSLSDNDKLLGRPINFCINIQELRLSAGAGFIVCLTGKVMIMPGLPKTPAANNMDISKDGVIKGLF